MVDCKVNEHTVNEKQPDGTLKPVFYESDPRLRNLAAVTAAELPPTAILRRKGATLDHCPHKFMVLLTGHPPIPKQVWSGSTNLTEGGIHGQANVGHIYFTEFNRLFNHYYFRSIAERSTPTETLRGLYLVEDDSWLEKYRPGTLRSKRVECFVEMAL